MNRELIKKTEEFLKTTFAESEYLKSNAAESAYRLEHSYRVANIAKSIAEAEGFDAYRIYETLEFIGFSKMSLEEKKEEVNRVLERLPKLKEMKLGSAEASKIWIERIEYYISFYTKLRAQLDISAAV